MEVSWGNHGNILGVNHWADGGLGLSCSKVGTLRWPQLPQRSATCWGDLSTCDMPECATPRRHGLGANVMAVPVRDVTLKGGKTFIWDDRTVDFIIYLYSLYMLHTCWMILFGLDWSLQTVHGPKAIKTRAPQSMPKSSHRVQMYITGILSFYPLCQYTPRWWVIISFGIAFGNATWLENPPFVGDFWWFFGFQDFPASDETWG